MDKPTPHTLLLRFFLALRVAGLDIGIDALLVAYRSVPNNWELTSVRNVYQVTRLLWCSDRNLMVIFDLEWAALSTNDSTLQLHIQSAINPDTADIGVTELPDVASTLLRADYQTSTNAPPDPSVAALRIYAPYTPLALRPQIELEAYWPVTRRSMIYCWRLLARPIANGPADVVDIDATIQVTAQQGFYLSAVYRRRPRNNAHLVLLMDQDGSMTPFSYIMREIAETARYESGLDPDRVDIAYFHNVPSDQIYCDPYMTDPETLDNVLSHCTPDSAVLIVSDAGAARGTRRAARIRATNMFIAKVRLHTQLIAWLNPMPIHRWNGTSAHMIARRVPSFQMDSDGLRAAIDVLRGMHVSRVYADE